MFLRHLYTEITFQFVIVEPDANVKTLLIEGSYSSLNSYHRVIYERHYVLTTILELILDLMALVVRLSYTRFSFSLAYSIDT